MGGLSNWRGKINSTSGTVTLDAAAQTGTVDVKMDMSDIDFGHDKLNAHAKGDEIFDAAKFPAATYTGKLVNFKNGAPTEVDGTPHPARRDQAGEARRSTASCARRTP